MGDNNYDPYNKLCLIMMKPDDNKLTSRERDGERWEVRETERERERERQTDRETERQRDRERGITQLLLIA